MRSTLGKSQDEMAFVSIRGVLAHYAQRLNLFAKGCQQCQVHTGIQHASASELHDIIKTWPFRCWTLYLVGEI